MRLGFSFCLLFCLAGPTLFAQTLLSEQDFIARALATNPAAESARLGVQQSKQLQGTALSLPDPVFNAESPTGEFYALGVLQTFRLPGYYQKQSRLLKSQTGLSAAQQNLTRAEIMVRARTFYLTAQYYQALDSLLRIQDSLYSSIAVAANRLYNAGQQDALQASFTATQAEEIRIALEANQASLNSALQVLQRFGHLDTPPRIASLQTVDTVQSYPLLSADLSPAVQVARQQFDVSHQQIKLEQARFKPSFSVGYLNQGPLTTPNALRYRAAIDIPLWTKQYQSSIKAARTGKEIASRNLENTRLSFSIDSLEIMSGRQRLLRSIRSYQRVLIPRSDQIISSSTRLRQVGQIDMIAHLRTVNDAFAIKLRYLDLLRQWRESFISAAALTSTQNP